MNVLFRCDASTLIGTGHVMRCLTLAHHLREREATCVFACAVLDGNLLELVRERGFATHALGVAHSQPADGEQRGGSELTADKWRWDADQTLHALGQANADWLIVDHYALDAPWERTLRSKCRRVLAIDDLADRPHDCDVLLDQNFHPDAPLRYRGLVPDSSVRLLGPQYALLRPEFVEARRGLAPRDGQVRRVLVAFGGADPANMTARALAALCTGSLAELAVDVVASVNNRQLASLESAVASRPRTTLHVCIDNIAALMSSADLAVGAGGISTWERLCVGLFNVTIAIATNQMEAMEALAKAGYLRYLGLSDSVTADDIADAVLSCIEKPGELAEFARAAMALVDGQGAARVAEILETHA